MVLGPWVVCLFPGMTRSMLCAARFPFVHKIIHPKEEKYRTELRLQHAYMRGWELLVTLQKKLMTKKNCLGHLVNQIQVDLLLNPNVHPSTHKGTTRLQGLQPRWLAFLSVSKLKILYCSGEGKRKPN